MANLSEADFSSHLSAQHGGLGPHLHKFLTVGRNGCLGSPIRVPRLVALVSPGRLLAVPVLGSQPEPPGGVPSKPCAHSLGEDNGRPRWATSSLDCYSSSRATKHDFPRMAHTWNTKRNQDLLYTKGVGSDWWVNNPPQRPQHFILYLVCNIVVPAHEKPLQCVPALLFFSSLMVKDSWGLSHY